jgi:hypothetical protein
MVRPRRLHTALVLKGSALLVCAGYILSNHPPAQSQAPTTLVDVRQDQEIESAKVEAGVQSAAISKLEDTIVDQGKDIARLDTKVTMFFSLLGALNVGGIALHMKKRREEGGEA